MFRIGQKIKCINNKNTPELMVGNYYTIKDIDDDSLLLVEFANIYIKNGCKTRRWYYFWHFIPLKEDKGTTFIEDYIEIEEQVQHPSYLDY